MNWAGWGPTIVAIIAAVFTYGRLTERQTEHTKRLDDHDNLFEAQGAHLNRVDLALVRLEEYQRGFGDATRLAKSERKAVI